MVSVHDSTGVSLSCCLACMQTAFKRSSPTSATDAASANEGGETSGRDCSVSGEAPTTDVIDWDSVKPDDKFLVLQVCDISVCLSIIVWGESYRCCHTCLGPPTGLWMQLACDDRNVLGHQHQCGTRDALVVSSDSTNLSSVAAWKPLHWQLACSAVVFSVYCFKCV